MPGLSVHPAAKRLKKSFKTCRNIIWHEHEINSLSLHESDDNRRCTLDVLLNILEPFQNQYSTYVYNYLIGRPDIQKVLIPAWEVSISPEKHLLSSRKKTVSRFQWRAVETVSVRRHWTHVLQDFWSVRTIYRGKKSLKVKEKSVTKTTKVDWKEAIALIFVSNCLKKVTVAFRDSLGVHSPDCRQVRYQFHIVLG